MVLYNVGSIALDAGNQMGWNVVSNLSGTTLNNMVVQEINYANTFTNDNIGTTGIAEQYQPALIDLVLSKLMFAVEMQQGGIDSVSLGDLSVSQAGGGGTEIGKQLRIDAIARLKELGRYVRFKRVLGGC